jgi:predicted transposase YbfD/YdcC
LPKKTLEAAKASNNEVVVQVKGNQKQLLKDCIQTSETIKPSNIYKEPFNKAHNRIECRKVEVYENKIISDKVKWTLVEVIVKVERRREVFDTKKKCWQNTDETSFYISTTVLSAEEFCKAIRNHWGIENRNHYIRDERMNEDKCRIRINPNVFAKLRSFALNIMRANKVENINLELFDNCMKLENILYYKGIKEN